MEGKGSFEVAWMLFRGLEETWIDIIERPDLVKSMSDRAVDAVIKLGLMVADECEVDGIWITDDLGTQHAPYFSPQVYRDLFKENHRKLAEAFHEKGLRMTFHSHGNVMAFFDDFVEVGFDSIDPLDEYDGIDLKVLKKRYGDKTTLKGGISCTIGHMKPAEIEHHVREIARIGGSERFILSSAGGVPPEMPLESFNTYRSIIQMVRRGT
jgi:uroporphyrinogen decarboxylase